MLTHAHTCPCAPRRKVNIKKCLSYPILVRSKIWNYDDCPTGNCVLLSLSLIIKMTCTHTSPFRLFFFLIFPWRIRCLSEWHKRAHQGTSSVCRNVDAAVLCRCAARSKAPTGGKKKKISLSTAAYNNIYMYMRVISWRDGAGWYPTGRETINQRLNSHLSELWIERVKKTKTSSFTFIPSEGNKFFIYIFNNLWNEEIANSSYLAVHRICGRKRLGWWALGQIVDSVDEHDVIISLCCTT